MLHLLSLPLRIGKTTWLREAWTGRSGVRGFVTPDVAGRRVVELLATGEVIPLEEEDGEVTIGRFRFAQAGIAAMSEELRRAAADPTVHTLVVDEVGPLELRRGEGVQVEPALEAARRGVDVVLVVREGLRAEAMERFGVEAAQVNAARWFRPVPAPVGWVLAGGQSRRMGRDKAFIDRGDGPAFAVAGRALEGALERIWGAAEVAISGRADAEYAPWTSWVDAPDLAGHGPASGVLTAARQRPGRALLVCGCDYPGLQPTALDRLVAVYRISGRSACYLGEDGGPEPLVALYAPAELEALEAAVRRGNDSLRALLRAAVAEGRAVALPYDPGLGIVSVDVP